MAGSERGMEKIINVPDRQICLVEPEMIAKHSKIVSLVSM